MLSEHFCEIFFEFRPVVREKMLFKDISNFSSGSHFVQLGRAVCAILVELNIRIISVKLY